MITDVFINRYPTLEIDIPAPFFVQLFNLYDDHHLGIKKALLEKFEGYDYSSYIDEHIRIIAFAHKKISNELGYANLDKPQYQEGKRDYNDHRIIKHYIHDKDINPLEKLSFLEILFRDAEQHLRSELESVEDTLPDYQYQALCFEMMHGPKVYNSHRIKAEDILPKQKMKKEALSNIQTEIAERLKLHKIPLAYHNGYFQQSFDPVIEEKISEPVWKLIAAPKFKNVEIDLLEALDRYNNLDRDPAFYAAKALESMIKIICADKGLTKGREKGAGDFLSYLNSKDHGPIITNDERNELTSMFRVRNSEGHGPGGEKMPSLTSEQAHRYIHAAMIWIYTLAHR